MSALELPRVVVLEKSEMRTDPKREPIPKGLYLSAQPRVVSRTRLLGWRTQSQRDCRTTGLSSFAATRRVNTPQSLLYPCNP